MNERVFDPERYGMVICQYCNSTGYIQYPKRQCCRNCGGFGFIKKEAKKDMDAFTSSGKCEGMNDGGVSSLKGAKAVLISCLLPSRNRQRLWLARSEDK